MDSRVLKALAAKRVISLVLLLLVGACDEPRNDSAHGLGNNPADQSLLPQEGGPAAESRQELPDARALGIRGWQKTDKDSIGREIFADDGIEQRASVMRSLAEARPELTLIPDGEGRLHLTGLVEPRDADAIAGVFASAQLKQTDLASVPPVDQMRSLGDMAAAIIQLLSVESSSDALVGPEGSLAVATRFERVARDWPEDARVWRVTGLPPDADGGPLIRFLLENAAGNLDEQEERAQRRRQHNEQRHARLRDVGILEFDPVDGGSLGDLITAWIEIPYQNQNQRDRVMSFRFAYDRGTDRWVLFMVHSRVHESEMMRLLKAGQMDEYRGTSHEIDLLELLPECHLVVGKGGPLLCK